jgi:hypothetical protein
MKMTLLFGLSIFAIGFLASSLIQPVTAQSTFSAPEYVFKDQNGAVVGGTSDLAFKGNAIASMYNATHDERYFILFFSLNATDGADRIAAEQNDVYYSNPDCTGTAYILAPSEVDIYSKMRGSVYAIGRKPGAANGEDSLVLRGSGAGANNSASQQSKYRSFSDPACTSPSSTTRLTVVGSQVDDLSSFVRPFVLD